MHLIKNCKKMKGTEKYINKINENKQILNIFLKILKERKAQKKY